MAKGAFIGVPTIIPASTPLGNKAVGDIVKLNVGGVAVDFIVVQQGNPNATLYDASCDGTWLLMKDVYVVKAWDSTDNDYANSDAHAYLNGDFLGLFDSNIQSVIKQVKIPYRAGAGGDNTVTSGANGLSAKAFLLSSAETNFNLGTNQPNEGVTLSYFVGCANGADSKRIAYYNGAKYGWWFRSPYRGNNNQAIYVYYDNGSYNLANVSTANGIGLRPALILPTTLGVEEDGTVLSTPASSGDETPVEVAREVKQMFVGVEKKVGSLKYLDYIESSGTQYIDTGVNPNQDTRVVISAKFNTQPNTDSAIFGIRNSNTMQFWCYWRNSDAKYAFRFGSSSTNNLVAATSTEQNTIDANKNVLTIGANSATAAAATFTATYSMYLFAVNNAGSMQYPASVKIYSCQIYDNGALVRDFVPCENESGEVGMYDKLNNVFYANDGTGVFTAGSVVEEIGGTITSIARKVKKAWIGVNGIARLFFGGGELSYYGTATALSVARTWLSASSVGDYALFAGGYSGSYLNTVDAYNKTLTRSTATNLYNKRGCIAATSIGDYALFAGGGYDMVTTAVDTYNKSLTHSSAPSLSNEREYAAATSVGDYALIAGGSSGSKIRDTVETYNKSLTHSSATALSQGRYEFAATTVGNYALFGGGMISGNYSKVVDAYNASLTRTVPTAFSKTKRSPAVTTIGNYALFAGGFNNTTPQDVVEAYDKSLVKSMATVLSVGRYEFAATTLGDYAIFAGGCGDDFVYDTVDVYDKSLTRTIFDGLSTSRYYLVAMTIGDYALFGGGQTNNKTYSNVVDVYTVS